LAICPGYHEIDGSLASSPFFDSVKPPYPSLFVENVTIDGILGLTTLRVAYLGIYRETREQALDIIATMRRTLNWSIVECVPVLPKILLTVFEILSN
jgi:hypothetical protein